jgi:site-specific DNA-cytosine methylase
MYDSMGDQIRPPNLDEAALDDLAKRHIHCDFSGKPCQAWTQNRERRGFSSHTGSVKDHPGYNVLFDESLRYLDSTGEGIKHGGISEQVPGFKHAATGSYGDTHEFDSPYSEYKAKLHKRGMKVGVATLNLDTWISEPSRERLFIIYVDEFLGGKKALKWILEAIQELRFSCVLSSHPNGRAWTLLIVGAFIV